MMTNNDTTPRRAANAPLGFKVFLCGAFVYFWLWLSITLQQGMSHIPLHYFLLAGPLCGISLGCGLAVLQGVLFKKMWDKDDVILWGTLTLFVGLWLGPILIACEFSLLSVMGLSFLLGIFHLLLPGGF